MTRRSRAVRLALLATLATLISGVSALSATENVQELEWEDLMPEGWDPFAALRALMESRQEDLVDGSVEAEQLMQQYTAANSSAPVVTELDGKQVRLPGFVVPLDFEGTEVSEFLLVPYFGACIHTPPPPANQIVYVKTAGSYPMEELYTPVWVTGTLNTQAFYNDVGDAGYTIKATQIEPYE